MKHKDLFGVAILQPKYAVRLTLCPPTWKSRAYALGEALLEISLLTLLFGAAGVLFG